MFTVSQYSTEYRMYFCTYLASYTEYTASTEEQRLTSYQVHTKTDQKNKSPCRGPSWPHNVAVLPLILPACDPKCFISTVEISRRFRWSEGFADIYRAMVNQMPNSRTPGTAHGPVSFSMQLTDRIGGSITGDLLVCS